MKDLDLRLGQKEIQKDLDSIPNSDLSVVKCVCGGVTWEVSVLLFRIPALHPKNGTGKELNRPVNVCTCKKCGKANPDHSTVGDPDYIENLPEELKP